MGDALGERFEQLVHRVLAPLVLGGPVHLVRPVGARAALSIGDRTLADGELETRLDVARVRRARLLAPVDTLAPIDGASYALLAALNDLLQVTNHELGGPFTRGRYHRLLANVQAVCEAVPPPHDVGAALGRHATFARVLDLARTDTTVRWWTGSARFRGQRPPGRLLLWPGVRQVHLDERKVPLAELVAGVPLPEDAYREVLALWLGRTPLTDLATATRKAPRFGWSASTLALVATAPGRALAFRAMARQPSELVTVVLARAAKEVPPAFAGPRRLAESFASEVAAGLRLASPSAAAK
ncbi:MAG TPA: hypothetical protein VHB21_17390 [Minicystis sp.]|nr:hypothetical protein [Minicystis sp.]